MSGEKTQPATQKKIDDSRKEGQIAHSKDVVTVLHLLVGYSIFFVLSDNFNEAFSKLLDSIITIGFSQQFTLSADLVKQAVNVFFICTFPIVFGSAVAGLVASWLQNGFVVAPKAAAPSFKKLDAVGNLKNMLSKKSFIQLFLSLVKVSIVVWIVYLVFESEVNDIVLSYRLGFSEWLTVFSELLKKTIYIILAIFLVIALIDWIAEKAHLMKNLRMSHQDLKQEHKETQGNPEIISKRKQEHRSILNSALGNVGSSKAVVTNPTHVAVALDFEPGVHDIPYIVAMGVDHDAMQIRKIAQEHGIPIIINVKLARMLYNDCEEEEYIHREHLAMAAEVFRLVLGLEKQQVEENAAQQEQAQTQDSQPGGSLPS
jgi:type III secretion protein U